MNKHLVVVSDCHMTMMRQRDILSASGQYDISMCLSDRLGDLTPSQSTLIWAHNTDDLLEINNVFMCSDGELPSRLDSDFDTWVLRVDLALAAFDQAPAQKIVILAASTGGPELIIELLAKLPPMPDTAVVIVQHQHEFAENQMLKGFQEQSAWLIQKVDSPVAIRPGICYYLPAGRKVDLRHKGMLQPSLKPWNGQFAPSIDHVVGSFARRYGDSLLVCYLTGLAGEGPSSARIAEAVSAKILLQNKEHAVAPGMVDSIAAVVNNFEWVHPGQVVERITTWRVRGY